MNYKELAEQALDYIVEQRRWCHQNPELSLEEVQTTEHIAAELQQGMSQEQIQEMFFSEYELIGYVNLYAGQTLFENPASQDSSGKAGFFIFYEEVIFYCIIQIQVLLI